MNAMENALLLSEKANPTKEVYLALSKYYSGAEKPLRALAYALDAHRLGAKVENLGTLEIACASYKLSDDLYGSYLLGRSYSALAEANSSCFDLAVYYLQAAANAEIDDDPDKTQLIGTAALYLADLLRSSATVNASLRASVAVYYRKAAQCGNSDTLPTLRQKVNAFAKSAS